MLQGGLTVLSQQDGSVCDSLQSHPDGSAIRLQRQQRLEYGQQLEGSRKAADLRAQRSKKRVLDSKPHKNAKKPHSLGQQFDDGAYQTLLKSKEKTSR